MPIRVLLNTLIVQDLESPVPVILVPGIMGSKVRFWDDAVWDPDHKQDMVTTWGNISAFEMRKRFANGTKPNIDGLMGLDKLGTALTPISRGFCSAMKEYGECMLALAKFLEPARMPVYVLGYDWSKTNFKSGARLPGLVDKVLALYPGSKQVIIITHSNGGLVTRAACKLYGLEKRVLAVIHAAMPRYGSSFSYARCFHGYDERPVPFFDDIAANIFSQIAGKTWWEWLAKLCFIPTACQLLPWSKYLAYDRSEGSKPEAVPGAKGSPWLSLDGRPVDTSDPFEMYQKSSFPGICFDWPDPSLPADDDNPRASYGKLRSSFGYKSEWDITIKELKANLVEAKSFDSQVGSYLHPNTYWVVGMGIPTPSSVEAMTAKKVVTTLATGGTSTTSFVTHTRFSLATVRQLGDGSVGGQTAGGGIADASKGYFIYKGSAFDHQGILNAPDVQNEILRMLTKILPGRINWPTPPPAPPAPREPKPKSKSKSESESETAPLPASDSQDGLGTGHDSTE